MFDGTVTCDDCPDGMGTTQIGSTACSFDPTTSPTSAPTTKSNAANLAAFSSAATESLGIGIPLGIICCGFLAFCLYKRRNNRENKPLTPFDKWQQNEERKVAQAQGDEVGGELPRDSIVSGLHQCNHCGEHNHVHVDDLVPHDATNTDNNTATTDYGDYDLEQNQDQYDYNEGGDAGADADVNTGDYVDDSPDGMSNTQSTHNPMINMQAPARSTAAATGRGAGAGGRGGGGGIAAGRGGFTMGRGSRPAATVSPTMAQEEL